MKEFIPPRFVCILPEDIIGLSNYDIYKGFYNKDLKFNSFFVFHMPKAKMGRS